MPDGPDLTPEMRAEALRFLGGMVAGYTDLTAHIAFFRANGIASPYYMPEDIFYALIMPVLNTPDRAAILRDKQNYDLLPGWPRRPVTLGRIMNGRLLDPTFRPTTPQEVSTAAQGLDEVVIKPSRDSSGGKMVRFCDVASLSSLISDLKDAVVQRPIVQHRDLRALNPGSVNTVRAITYRRLDGQLVWISATLRMGRGSMRVDNHVAGGIACAVADDGRLADVGFDKKFRRYDGHPDTMVAFAGRVLPGFDQLREAALAAHERTPWIDFASWDIAIEEDGKPTIVEVNVGTSLGLPQLVNGPILAPVLDDMKRRIGHRRYLPILGFL